MSLYVLYLAIHDEHHGFSIVRVCGYKVPFFRISVNKVHFNELPVHISTIKYAVVDTVKQQI